MTGDPTPAPDADDPPAGLFGSPSGGTFRPVPVVHIDGVQVASGMPADWSADQVVIDGVSITWGREDVLDQPDPATGSLQLFDATGSWATARDLRGRRVDLFWSGEDPATGLPVERAYFRGRVGSPVRVSRKTVTGPDGRPVIGSLIELPLVSLLLDLANRVPDGGWPAETLAERRDRIAAFLTGTLPGGVLTREFWDPALVAPIAAKDQISLYEHLNTLYDSTGSDRLTYQVDAQRAFYQYRRAYTTARGHGRLWWNTATDGTGSARAQQGVYARAVGTKTAYHYLDAAALEYPEDAGITSPDRITRVRVTHPDATDDYNDRTAELPVTGTDEARDGVRTATLDSIVVNPLWADIAVDSLEELARQEAAEWRLEPFTWSTRKTGGFDSYAQAAALLAGEESQALFFLQRSYLPTYGIRPVFGVMGQTITYRDGGWELECQVAPLSDELPQHPITWEEFDDGSTGYEVRWHDGDHPRGMHESLTYEDLGWVSRGLGPSAMPTGPDQGWDFLP